MAARRTAWVGKCEADVRLLLPAFGFYTRNNGTNLIQQKILLGRKDQVAGGVKLLGGFDAGLGFEGLFAVVPFEQLSPVTSKPASRGRIKTSHSEVLISYQVH